MKPGIQLKYFRRTVFFHPLLNRLYG